MRIITLKTTSDITLYEGRHATLGEAIEAAIAKNISLDHIDLSHSNLRNVTMDGVSIAGGNFTEADLTGANLSESVFTNCNFSGARLVDTCLCYSNMSNCNFKYAEFGATDISMCALHSCTFEGWSTFRLDFDKAQILTNLTFTYYSNILPFSEPPIVINSDGVHCAIFGNILIYKEYNNTLGEADTHQKTVLPPPKDVQSLIDFLIGKIG